MIKIITDKSHSSLTPHKNKNKKKQQKQKHIPGNFFQNNPHMLPKMVTYVLTQASLPSPTSPLTHLVDAYCGSGLFCLSAHSLFSTCVGIEVNESAISEANENARINGIENCEFTAASSEVVFGGIRHFPRERTAVIMDPPRKGSSEDFLDQLCDFRPQRIIYMSCGPDTQARDAGRILETGRYEVKEIQPIDLFPQTRHIECCVVFEYVGGR